jgi:collagenase-like PrtC family protease
VLATQALVETEADLRLIERQGEQTEFAVEAGDAAALQLLAGRVPLVLGPHLNIYSRAALVEHAGLGATHWVAPVELALDAIASVNPPTNRVTTPAGEPIATEAWAFGRVPLSMSARCFTARHHGLAKDQCGYKCLADGDGLPMQSSDAQPFLVLNGTQTQSAGVHCLLGDGAGLRQAGVQSLRLSPCDQGFGQVLRDFDEVMNQGSAAVAAALQGWPALGVPGPLSNGYARHRPGMEWSTS